jgi:xanthine dehydrogenase accessory factor
MHPLPVLDELGHLLATEAGWRAAGHRTAIATVIQTWGSAPRRRGAHLIVRGDGLFEGSVSGGCVEGDVITQAVEAIAQGASRRIDYGVSEARAWEVGLACGGQIAIFVQPVDDTNFPPALLLQIIAARTGGQRFTVSTDLVTGRSIAGEQTGESRFVQTYDPPLRLAIIGAVHISQALLPMAAQLGYQTLIIDPRTAFATAERFPAAHIDTRWPDEVLPAWQPDGASAVVTLTHDPKIDDPALTIALASPAFYVGALGSRRTHATRLERLAAAGIGPDDLARIHGPVGLSIGAANPAEIALSIMAGITAAWRQRP